MKGGKEKKLTLFLPFLEEITHKETFLSSQLVGILSVMDVSNSKQYYSK